ncbi:hypothetical protein REPUB_Repub05bG0166600 [Reevesia pubescens]
MIKVEEMCCVYKNSNAPIEDRIKDLVSRMSLQEKIGQMAQIEPCVATPDDVRDLSIGSMISGGGKGPLEKAVPSDWADTVDRFQRAALDSRLGIPLIYGIDAVHDLAQRIGAAVALRASRIHFNFAQCRWKSVCKDPRWGRCHESFSEETNIVKKMTSITTGLQGQQPVGHLSGYPFVADRDKVIACAKHFVGDGGVSTVMASYSSWNGCKLHAHCFLLTEILKDKLGFKVMLPHRYKQFIEDLTSLVESGDIQMSRIDDAVERILRVKFVAGLFEYPFSDRSLLDMVGCKLHIELAREAVRKSLVLLKNGKNPGKPFLPLDKNAKRVLIAGTHADNLGYQCGGGHITGREAVAELQLNPHIGNPDIWKTLGYRAMGFGKSGALVAAWLPGTEGRGLTDVVFGDYEFECQLPMTWFWTIKQLPMNTEDNSCDPLFALGFGLSCSKEKPVD